MPAAQGLWVFLLVGSSARCSVASFSPHTGRSCTTWPPPSPSCRWWGWWIGTRMVRGGRYTGWTGTQAAELEQQRSRPCPPISHSFALPFLPLQASPSSAPTALAAGAWGWRRRATRCPAWAGWARGRRSCRARTRGSSRRAVWLWLRVTHLRRPTAVDHSSCYFPPDTIAGIDAP